MEGFIFIQFFFDKFRVFREYIVPVCAVVIRLSINQIFCNFAEFRIDIFLLQFFFLFMLQDHVCCAHQSIGHKCGNLIGKFRINFMLEHTGTHNHMIAHILHPAGTHNRIIKINFRHITRSQFALQNQNFRFNPIAVCRNVHFRRNTQRFSCLFDNGRMAFGIPYPEYIIEVSIANFLAFHGCLVPVKTGDFFAGILFGILQVHQEIAIKL